MAARELLCPLDFLFLLYRSHSHRCVCCALNRVPFAEVVAAFVVGACAEPVRLTASFVPRFECELRRHFGLLSHRAAAAESPLAAFQLDLALQFEWITQRALLFFRRLLRRRLLPSSWSAVRAHLFGQVKQPLLKLCGFGASHHS